MPSDKLKTPMYESTLDGMVSIVTVSPEVAIHFVYPGEPVSKERPLFNRKTGHAYTPPKTRKAEKELADFYKQEIGDVRLTGFLDMSVTFFLSNQRKIDVDNMGKLVLDALNGLAYEDDTQVHRLCLTKRYTTPSEARIEVSIRLLEFELAEGIHHASRKDI